MTIAGVGAEEQASPRRNLPPPPTGAAQSRAPIGSITIDVTAPSSPASADPPARPAAGESRRRRRAFDEASLRAKLTALLAAVTLWGAVVGYGLAHVSLGGAWLVGIAAGVAVLGILAGRQWIIHPLEDLVAQVCRVARVDSSITTRHLPRHRDDELGQLARAIHQLVAASRRNRVEANQLRRTLDDRITRATRAATAQLEQLAMRDSMTRLANRRFLDEHLDQLLGSCHAAGTDLICIMIDLDNFKSVNDQLGHAVGDELLRFAAHLIRASVRDDDYAVRMGGDEFAVFMPGCELDRAAAFCRRVGAMFAEHVHLSLGHRANVSMSFGIASLLRDGARDGEQLMQLADTQLYKAKHNGKAQTAGA